MDEYVIVGDTEEFEDCLVCVCGADKEHAEKVLDRMLNNPSEHDKRLMERHSNFRIEVVKKEHCWWNDPFLSN